MPRSHIDSLLIESKSLMVVSVNRLGGSYLWPRFCLVFLRELGVLRPWAPSILGFNGRRAWTYDLHGQGSIRREEP